MQTASPASRTGRPGSAAATRSRIGKSRQAVRLSGLTVPVGRCTGPADPMPAPRDPVLGGHPGYQRLHDIPDGFGVVTAWCRQLFRRDEGAVGVDESGGDLGAADVESEREFGHVAVGSVSVNIIGLAGVSGVFIAGSESDQIGPPGVEPIAEGPTAGGGQ